MKIETLKKRYENACNNYVKMFVKKHGYEFDYWIGDDVGGIASFIEEYFFCMDEIVYDINNNCPEGLIFSWQDDCVEHDGERINFRSYAMGLRFGDLEHLKD